MKIIKKIRYVLMGLAAVSLFVSSPKAAITARAVQYDQVTITIDAVDDSGSLQYAIDSDAPEAFSDRSSFQVAPGSTHTIYVKDPAGNVTSQIYSVPEREPAQSGQSSPIQASTSVNESYDPDTDERRVNIDVNLTNGAYGASGYGSGSAAEDGGGTLFDKEKTDGTDASGKIFYTVTTKEGEVFYLVVDQNLRDNNVYLLTQATVNDLQYLADQNDYNFTVSSTGQNSQSLLDLLSGPNGSQSAEQLQQPQQPGGGLPTASSGMNSTLLIVVVVAIGGGGYYFFRTQKSRREKQMDEIDAANDLEDYEIADEGDGVEFDEAPAEEEEEEDEELMELMKLNTERVFGEEGEEESATESAGRREQGKPAAMEMGLGDYDEFEEEEDPE